MNTSSSRAARWAVSAIACLALGLRLTAAEASSTPPAATAETFVYVHGAWNGSYGLRKIERLLRAAGHEVYRPALTGMGERVHLAHASIDLDTHIQDVVNVIVWEDLRDVVLVGRSYGGMVITGVIDRVPERIKRVIYLDAFLPLDGESLLDISVRKVTVQGDGFVAPLGPPQPAKAPPHAVAQPGKTFSQKIRLQHPEAAARIPTTYLLTVAPEKRPEEDEFFKFAERARARGWKIVIMEADHSPEVSRPEALLPLFDAVNSLPRIEQLIDLALEEDLGLGDVTSRAIFSARDRSRAFIEAGQELVVCGVNIAARVFAKVDPALETNVVARDGDRVKRGDRVLNIAGPTASLLAAERTALNFLQRLSGVATQSRKFADAVKGTAARIVDTRKTTPGWRALEKYAVRCGGCFNHRSSLGEHVLIKDNHIIAAGSLAKAVKLARAAAPHLAKIEVEAKTLVEVKEAVRAGAEVILLDNMAPDMIRRAILLIDRAAIVEVSGGVRFESLLDYALPGVNVISVGALTHSAPAADLSLTVIPARKS